MFCLHIFQLNPDLLVGLDISPEIDLPEGTAADLAAEPELVPNPRLHPGTAPKECSAEARELPTERAAEKATAGEEEKKKDALSPPEKPGGGGSDRRGAGA